MKESTCRILTLGFHWWKYYPGEKRYVRCRLCGRMPKSMWTQREKILRRNVMTYVKGFLFGCLAGLIILLLISLCGGCTEVGLRFAPSQAIKANAELTNQLARKINTEGTDPGSSASNEVVAGTTASLAYTGRPNEAPNPDSFTTVNDQALTDATDRPDVAGTMDSMLELGLGVAALFGGAGGIKLAQNLKTMHAKAKGFTEVVTQNDIFKTIASPEEWAKFKRAFAAQTPATQKLVAGVKTERKINTPLGVV